jgi:hypothetical protein
LKIGCCATQNGPRNFYCNDERETKTTKRQFYFILYQSDDNTSKGQRLRVPIVKASDKMDPSESPCWSILLQETRDLREKQKAQELSGDNEMQLERFRTYFSSVKYHLLVYAKTLTTQENNGSEEQTQISGVKKKRIILDTRSALRFGLSCLSFEVADVRRTMQNQAVLVYQWHISLASLLSQKDGDSKCRHMSARILSNLVTANFETASKVSSTLALCPSKDDVSSRIIDNLSDQSSDRIVPDIEPNWVDMILSSAYSANREAVAAIVAALHNCIASLETLPAESYPPSQFPEELASNSMLISTLLRQLISVESLKQAIDNDVDHYDVATEWISLLLSKLSRLGKLPSMYRSISGPESANNCSVLPEQVILLHCMAKEIEETVLQPEGNLESGNPFGGEAGWDGISYSHVFLAELFSKLRASISSHTTVSVRQKEDESDIQIIRSALLTTLELLHASLGMDNSSSARLRLHLGTKTTLLQESAQDMGALVDTLSGRSFGRKARELEMSKDEQQMITALVRLQSNLCFHCSHNQDLMRLILVPIDTSKRDDVKASTTTERSALHVLLSCTSFSHACFTLREWSVVAIRNVLEENECNQTVVAELEAQQPKQTAELSQAGVRVDLDTEGKVSVVPLDTLKEDNIVEEARQE